MTGKAAGWCLPVVAVLCAVLAHANVHAFTLQVEGQNANPVVETPGSIVITTDDNGEALVKHLAPGKYGVAVRQAHRPERSRRVVIPPPG